MFNIALWMGNLAACSCYPHWTLWENISTLVSKQTSSSLIYQSLFTLQITPCFYRNSTILAFQDNYYHGLQITFLKECNVRLFWGSILGPLLFSIYMNGLPDYTSTHCHLGLFADDTKCFKKIESASDARILQEDLDNIFSWSKVHLNFNMTKCKALTVSRKFNPYLNGQCLSEHTILSTKT